MPWLWSLHSQERRLSVQRFRLQNFAKKLDIAKVYFFKDKKKIKSFNYEVFQESVFSIENMLKF